jgi:uncharacterized low-complexity protein
MENKKKSLLTGSLLAGALLGMASLQADASPLFRFDELGSGATVRNQLMDGNNTAARALELKCGKDSTGAKAKGKEGKCGAEGKCGEGKCGGKKGKGKDSTKAKPASSGN